MTQAELSGPSSQSGDVRWKAIAVIALCQFLLMAAA
jgi:hypothetical protein